MSLISSNQTKFEYSIYQNLNNDTVKFTMEDTSTLDESFRIEVMNHITNDLAKLSTTFSFAKENVSDVYIAHAGHETHYGGKKPLFITLNMHHGPPTKLVYKPRSVAPELIIEELLSKISNRVPRTLLDCHFYGYDAFVEGVSLQSRHKNPRDILITEGNKCIENLALLYTLNYLEIEDTHLENFILDNSGVLHFIDAEVFQTGISTDVSDLFKVEEADEDPGFTKSSNFQASPTLKLNLDLEKKLLTEGLSAKHLLQQIPTRLVICSTNFYFFPNSFFRPKYIKIENKLFSNLNKFEDYHTACLARFLCTRGKISVDTCKNFNDLLIKISSYLGKDNMNKINNELSYSSNLRAQNISSELPAFRFHLLEDWIECPLTKQKIFLKQQPMEEKNEYLANF